MSDTHLQSGRDGVTPHGGFPLTYVTNAMKLFRDRDITTMDIPKAELPAGKKLTIAVRPLSSLGTAGRAIATTWRV